MLITWSYPALRLKKQQEKSAAVVAAAADPDPTENQEKAAADPELPESDPGFGSEHL